VSYFTSEYYPSYSKLLMNTFTYVIIQFFYFYPTLFHSPFPSPFVESNLPFLNIFMYGTDTLISLDLTYITIEFLCTV
jgi:hypothetical protein